MSTTLRPHRSRPARVRSATMPDDARLTLARVDALPVSPADDRAVWRWLLACAVAVALAVAVGGITRLTESGLSITEWKPVSGILPPLSAAQWSDAYARYLAIPEAQTVHQGITIAEFKGLFWWEWTHRMLARGVGLVLAVPFFVLLLRRQIRPDMRLRLMNLPLLAALQGVMGWYMVQSGLAGRTSVSPYRLVAHLAIALVIFAIAIWSAAEVSRRQSSRDAVPAVPRYLLPSLAALVCLTILSGGFVAGLDAGRIFNTFPLMEGRLIPVGYQALDGWRNAFENPVAAQLHHRFLAIGTTVLVLVTCVVAFARSWPQPLQEGLLVAAAVVLAQLALGIGTLLLAVPIPMAVLHQLTALVLLAVLLVISQRATTHPDSKPRENI